MKHRRVEASQQLEKWAAFQTWLNGKRVEGGGDDDGDGKKSSLSFKYDTVIDGANVGYYNQNYAGAPTHVDYQQIDWMVRQVEGRGYKPLLVLHSRHLHRRSISKRSAAIIADWISKDILLQTPAGCNDDWFWLYTAVAIKAKVVTNDEMRDHHFLMLSPKWFSRWKERNQIRFSFGAWVDTNTNTNTHTNTHTNSNTNSSSLIKRRKLNGGAGDNNDDNDNDDDNDDNDNDDDNDDNDNDNNDNKDEYRGGISKWKEALLSIPLKYSHRIQRLTNSNGHGYDGYYFPAVDSDQWLCCYKVH